MYGINKVIENLYRDDYSEHLADDGYEIDCSLGENPYGVAPDLKIDEGLYKTIACYPHSEETVKDALIKRYSSTMKMKSSNIALTCGSIGGLICLNRIFMKKGKKIIGVAPQFTAVVDDFNIYEAVYLPLKLKKENNYKFDINEFLDVIKKEEEAYIYLDNPNNPTGQIIDINDIEKILKIAKANNSFVCIDEAYGDYMKDENSSINLIEKYENLCVFRTLSKGTGGAGLRIGYLLSNENFINIFEKVNIPFATTGLSNYLAPTIIHSDWEKYAIEQSIKNKKDLLDSLKNIKVAHTAMEVPIAMYYVDDDIDLEKAMLKKGIRVVTCSGYEGVSRNYVRINLHKNFKRMKELMLEIDAEFKK